MVIQPPRICLEMYLVPCDLASGVTGANAERIDRMAEANLKPEQITRETIDGLLRQSGWIVQSKNKIDFSAGPGIARSCSPG